MNVNNRAAAAAVMVALFLMGAVAGGLVVGLLWRDSVSPPFATGERVGGGFERPGDIRGPRGMLPERYMYRLRRELDLSATQQDSVLTILEHQRQEAAGAMRELGPLLRAGMDSTLTQIRRVLDEDQQVRFDQIMEEEGQLMRRQWSPDRERP